MLKNYYFHKYLEVAPFSLALWRAFEAQKIAEGYQSLFKKRHKLDPNSDSQLIFERPLLDLGCGFGEFAGIFFERQVEIGVDINIEDLLKAKKKNKYHKLFMADARNLPFASNKFSTVISNSTIEHIPHPQKVLKEVFRVLKPGGIFIFTVPTVELNNHLFYPEIFKKIGFNNLSSFYLRTYHKVFKHINIFTSAKWRAITEAAGFKITLLQGTFPRSLTLIFDLFLLTALPSQIGRWLLGDRWIWSLNYKRPILDKIYEKVLNDTKMLESNILVIARKK